MWTIHDNAINSWGGGREEGSVLWVASWRKHRLSWDIGWESRWSDGADIKRRINSCWERWGNEKREHNKILQKVQHGSTIFRNILRPTSKVSQVECGEQNLKRVCSNRGCSSFLGSLSNRVLVKWETVWCWGGKLDDSVHRTSSCEQHIQH